MTRVCSSEAESSAKRPAVVTLPSVRPAPGRQRGALARQGARALIALALSACAARVAPPPPPPPLASPDAIPTSAVNLSPVLTVSSNAPEGEVRYGTTLLLEAACTDREDGAITGIRWSTDEGIFLGEGPALRHMPEAGSHLILATCTDRGGRATSQAATSRFVVVDRWTSADSVPVVVTLPFVTNRGSVAGLRAPGAAFDGTALDSLSRGVVTVNVPAHDFRRAGAASRTPFMRSVRGNFAANDAAQFALRAIEPVDSLTLAARLHDALAQAPAGEVLVFVHGYNTSFEAAISRAARLAAGLQYPGALILYSWPSDGELASYRLDQRDARAAGAHLARFLAELRDTAGLRRISVVAHSMGGEVLAAALRSLDADRRPLMLGDAVFISPDVAAGEFLQEVLPSLRARASRVTVYASAADFALWSSWGSNRERRLGLGGRFATVARGVETVELSYDNTDRLGHNPFDAEGFRDDLHRLLVQGLSASRRGLVTVTRDDGQTMWRLP